MNIKHISGLLSWLSVLLYKQPTIQIDGSDDIFWMDTKGLKNIFRFVRWWSKLRVGNNHVVIDDTGMIHLSAKAKCFHGIWLVHGASKPQITA